MSPRPESLAVPGLGLGALPAIDPCPCIEGTPCYIPLCDRFSSVASLAFAELEPSLSFQLSQVGAPLFFDSAIVCLLGLIAG